MQRHKGGLLITYDGWGKLPSKAKCLTFLGPFCLDFCLHHELVLSLSMNSAMRYQLLHTVGLLGGAGRWAASLVLPQVKVHQGSNNPSSK